MRWLLHSAPKFRGIAPRAAPRAPPHRHLTKSDKDASASIRLPMCTIGNSNLLACCVQPRTRWPVEDRTASISQKVMEMCSAALRWLRATPSYVHIITSSGRITLSRSATVVNLPSDKSKPTTATTATTATALMIRCFNSNVPQHTYGRCGVCQY